MSSARSVLSTLIALGLILGVPGPGAAQLVSSSQALALEGSGEARAVVDAYLARAEVASELVGLGVDPELARLRAAAMSATELEELAGRIREAPAGGSGVITVLGITFVVLLVLELLGVIDVFKKI